MYPSDVYVLDFLEEVLCGYADKMNSQIGPLPSVSWPLAYSQESLSTTRGFGGRVRPSGRVAYPAETPWDPAPSAMLLASLGRGQREGRWKCLGTL